MKSKNLKELTVRKNDKISLRKNSKNRKELSDLKAATDNNNNK